MNIKNFHASNLHIDNFQPGEKEAWCIYGANNSGIATFVQLLAGQLPSPACYDCAEKPDVISFARLQEIFEEEVKKDNTDFLDRIDPGTPARAFLQGGENNAELIEAFNLHHCLDKGFRQLSTGESRKLILLGAFFRNSTSLLIENPYDGLDQGSCAELDHVLQILHRFGRRIIVTVNNICDIPTWCTHLAVLDRGHLCLQGKRQEIVDRLGSSLDTDHSPSIALEVEGSKEETEERELIALTDGSVRFGEDVLFSHLDLIVTSGRHTLITGPNGCGKSTLLQIITGDNQKCYANNLRLFGRQRGTGESIWELKKHMGIVSPDLHRNHYIPGSALQVVLSGFFDSIGVYRKFSESERQSALKWLKMIGLEEKQLTSFRQLSFAEQRLCLVARSLIKMPRLLILDEPTQGLDQENRKALLDFLERIAERRLSTIVYVSHRRDEFRSFFQQHIDLSLYG